MENPYDCGQRIALAQETGDYALWDYAFYQGSYYCYFGVVPAVLLFVPYKILTGANLTAPAAIEALGVLFIAALALLIYQISMQYKFMRRSELAVSLVFMLCCGASNVYYLGFASSFYSIPILASMFFTALGLWCWLKAKECLKFGQDTQWNSYLLVGTFCMSLNFGCRPQFVLACALALPIFFDEIFVTRQLFSRRSGTASLLVVAGIVMVVVPLMAYNYLRFGSVLNWGSSYNLTGFDMTSYVQSWKTSAFLMYSYLFQLPHFSSVFPFIDLANVNLDYGWAPNEPMFGGYIWLAPISFGLLLIPLVYKDLKAKRQRLLISLMIVCSAVAFMVDVRNAGITQRYFADFGMYVYLAASFLIFQFMESWQAKGLRRGSERTAGAACISGAVGNAAICAVLGMLLIASVALGALSFFSPDRYYSVALLNPDLYARALQLFASAV